MLQCTIKAGIVTSLLKVIVIFLFFFFYNFWHKAVCEVDLNVFPLSLNFVRLWKCFPVFGKFHDKVQNTQLLWLTQDFLEALLSKVLALLWRDYWYSYHSSWTPRLLYFHCLLQITRVSPQANNSLACLSVCANNVSFEVLKVTSGLKGHYYMTLNFIAKWLGPVSFVLLWSIHVSWLSDCSLCLFKL